MCKYWPHWKLFQPTKTCAFDCKMFQKWKNTSSQASKNMHLTWHHTCCIPFWESHIAKLHVHQGCWFQPPELTLLLCCFNYPMGNIKQHNSKRSFIGKINLGPVFSAEVGRCFEIPGSKRFKEVAAARGKESPCWRLTIWNMFKKSK